MALYKRKTVWWVSISHNGQRIQRSTGTTNKVAAQEFHDKFKAELWTITKLDNKEIYSWRDAVLRWLRESAQLGTHPQYVFTYKGNPIGQCNTKAWKNALERAGIENFRWHDLRHTWASWHVQNGTSLQELQLLGGWSSFEMVLRYAHLSSDHLRAAANRIGRMNNVTTCNLKAVA